MKKINLIIISICMVTIGFSQQVTKSTYGDVLLKNGTVHTITNGILDHTDVLIQDGKITYSDLSKPGKPFFSKRYRIVGKPDYIVKKNKRYNLLSLEI